MGLTDLKSRGADLDRLKSDRMRRFALEYPLDHNYTQAAIRAGYAKNSAAVTGARLLKNPIIKAYIGQLERQDVEQLGLDRLEVLKQLYYALTRQARDFVDEGGIIKPPHELPDQCQSIIDGIKQKTLHTRNNGEVEVELVETEYKLTPHATAREQAMKHEGLFAAELHEHAHVAVLPPWDEAWSGNGEPPDRIEQQLGD